MTRSRKNVIRAGTGGQSVRRASRKAPEDPDVINDLTNDAGLIAARAAEPGRGRKAEGPNDFPLRGWLDIGWRVAHSISTDRILATSGSVAFFALLAVFPAVATLVSLYGLAADVHAVAEHSAVLEEFCQQVALIYWAIKCFASPRKVATSWVLLLLSAF